MKTQKNNWFTAFLVLYNIPKVDNFQTKSALEAAGLVFKSIVISECLCLTPASLQ